LRIAEISAIPNQSAFRIPQSAMNPQSPIRNPHCHRGAVGPFLGAAFASANAQMSASSAMRLSVGR
jgi:hypothetical protein